MSTPRPRLLPAKGKASPLVPARLTSLSRVLLGPRVDQVVSCVDGMKSQVLASSSRATTTCRATTVRRERELEEARKARRSRRRSTRTARRCRTRTSRRTSSQAPWYLNQEGPGLKHQKNRDAGPGHMVFRQPDGAAKGGAVRDASSARARCRRVSRDRAHKAPNAASVPVCRRGLHQRSPRIRRRPPPRSRWPSTTPASATTGRSTTRSTRRSVDVRAGHGSS